MVVYTAGFEYRLLDSTMNTLVNTKRQASAYGVDTDKITICMRMNSHKKSSVQ